MYYCKVYWSQVECLGSLACAHHKLGLKNHEPAEFSKAEQCLQRALLLTLHAQQLLWAKEGQAPAQQRASELPFEEQVQDAAAG